MKKILKSVFVASTSWLPDRHYFILRHLLRFHRIPNIDHPETFNEHILHRMLYDKAPLRKIVADKIAVRDYVKEKVGEHVLPKLYWTGTSLTEKDFNALPDKFVVKSRHGSQMVIVVRDKKHIDLQNINNKMQEWSQVKYNKIAREHVYQTDSFECLIEEYLEDQSGQDVPPDYKFFVFNGVPKFVQKDSNRFIHHERNVYALPDWELLPLAFCYPNIQEPVQQPVNLEKMLDLCTALSKDFDFIRIDLYDLGDRVAFGEITNFPGSGNEKFEPRIWDQKIGEYFTITPSRYNYKSSNLKLNLKS